MSLAFVILFIISFACLWKLANNKVEQLLKQEVPDKFVNYKTESRFWFKSFQNWQSEFLAVAAIVLLSINLRQKGSSESKSIDATHFQTGD